MRRVDRAVDSLVQAYLWLWVGMLAIAVLALPLVFVYGIVTGDLGQCPDGMDRVQDGTYSYCE